MNIKLEQKLGKMLKLVQTCRTNVRNLEKINQMQPKNIEKNEIFRYYNFFLMLGNGINFRVEVWVRAFFLITWELLKN